MKTSADKMPCQRVAIVDGAPTCEMSNYQLNRLVTFLLANGHEIVNSDKDHDILVINGCGIWREKIRSGEALTRAALRREAGRLVVLYGCLANLSESLKCREGLVLVGPKDDERLDELFRRSVSVSEIKSPLTKLCPLRQYQSRITNADYHVLISQGCSNDCSYCNIKRAKGYVTSRDCQAIHEDVRSVMGRREAVLLLADDCGSYGLDIGKDLPYLLDGICSLSPTLRIKISSIHPSYFLRYYERMRSLLQSGRITYLNIPIQSGSQRVLKLMRRQYDIKKLKALLHDLRSISAGTWLYTHVMFGFPTETAAEFALSLKVAELFDEVLFVEYADNPGTAAYDIEPKVSPVELAARRKSIIRFLETHNGYLAQHD